jgi:hypothetical protein
MKKPTDGKAEPADKIQINLQLSCPSSPYDKSIIVRIDPDLSFIRGLCFAIRGPFSVMDYEYSYHCGAATEVVSRPLRDLLLGDRLLTLIVEEGRLLFFRRLTYVRPEDDQGFLAQAYRVTELQSAGGFTFDGRSRRTSCGYGFQCRTWGTFSSTEWSEICPRWSPSSLQPSFPLGVPAFAALRLELRRIAGGCR